MERGRRDVEERLECKTALDEPSVRNDQVRLGDERVSNPQNIQIERPRPEALTPHTTESPLDAQEGKEERARGLAKQEANRGVQMRGPGATHGLGFVQRGDRSNLADLPEFPDGAGKRRPSVSQVGAEADHRVDAIHLRGF
jgi:hypothetical protein